VLQATHVDSSTWAIKPEEANIGVPRWCAFIAVQQHEQQLQIAKKRPSIISLKKAWWTRPRPSSLSKISIASFCVIHLALDG
jgi:hypothetical protein